LKLIIRSALWGCCRDKPSTRFEDEENMAEIEPKEDE